jgi:hypothetical protein
MSTDEQAISSVKEELNAQIQRLDAVLADR